MNLLQENTDKMKKTIIICFEPKSYHDYALNDDYYRLIDPLININN